MKRDILEKPFDPAQIKQRVGTYGNVLDYVEGHTVIKRLNDAFDGAWCFEILKHKVLEETDEVLVLGKLTAGDVVKCQFGSSKITRTEGTKEIISLADDLKAAGTDCLKKCATMLGVGLYLYNGISPCTRLKVRPAPPNPIRLKRRRRKEVMEINPATAATETPGSRTSSSTTQ
jgi:hypothetical protein